MKKLNPQQQEAVDKVYGSYMVLASPGSGKTELLVERVAHLIKHGINPENILCVTFTNKAAKDMKERICKRLGADKAAFYIGTFHALCANILRKYGDRIGYHTSFTIIDQNDQKEMIDKTIRLLGRKKKDDGIDIHNIMNNVNMWRENLETEEELEDRFTDNDLYLLIAKNYLKELKEQNSFDFSALLSETVRLLRENKDLLERFQERFQFIQGDEFQDTNYVQFELLKLFSDKYKNIMLVGDISQSIYRFRNARYENITDFMQHYPDCKQLPLGQNYRSTPEILQVADKLIKHNSTHVDVGLHTQNSSGEDVECNEFNDPKEESRWIARKIKNLVEEYGYEYRDMAILYRINNLSLELQTALAYEGIPFNCISGYGFFDKKEIKDSLGFLRFLSNPKDTLAFHRISSLFHGIGVKSINAIENFAKKDNKSILEVCGNIEQYTSKTKVAKIAKEMSDIYHLESNLDVGDYLDLLVERFKYKEKLQLAYPDNYQERIENVEELINNATDFAQKSKSVEKYLQNIALITASDKENDGDAVLLSSGHSSKGCEFPIVFVVGLEEFLLPSKFAIADIENPQEAIEEETRVFYVMLTRAEKRLFVSYCKYRPYRDKTGFIRYKPSHPSRFLFEAGLLDKKIS